MQTSANSSKYAIILLCATGLAANVSAQSITGLGRLTGGHAS